MSLDLVDKIENWKVLISDDDDYIHEVTKLVSKKLTFDGKQIEYISAKNGVETIDKLNEHNDIALILLDVVMEDDNTGLDIVKYIREVRQDHLIRIVLRTGQPGYAPEYEVITKYDINDYKEKTELTADKLITTILVSLRNYRDLLNLSNSKKMLQIAKENAEESNNAKSRFLSNVSYELRTFLNSIILSTQLMQTTNLSHEQEEYTKILSQSTERILPLISDILDLSQIEKGNFKLDAKSHDFFEYFNQTLDNICKENSYRNQIELDISMNIPKMLRFDSTRLERVLNNLITVIINKIEEGYLNVYVKLLNETLKYVTLEIIIDSPVDFRKGHDSERLFDLFYQIESLDKTSKEGIGLNLTVVKGLIELMNGSIWIEDNAIGGIKIIFTIELEK